MHFSVALEPAGPSPVLCVQGLPREQISGSFTTSRTPAGHRAGGCSSSVGLLPQPGVGGASPKPVTLRVLTREQDPETPEWGLLGAMSRSQAGSGGSWSRGRGGTPGEKLARESEQAMISRVRSRWRAIRAPAKVREREGEAAGFMLYSLTVSIFPN